MCTCHIGTFDSGESERVKEVQDEEIETTEWIV